MPQCELVKSQADVLLHFTCRAQRIEQRQRELTCLSINRQHERRRERKIFFLWTRKLKQHFASAILARSKTISGKLRCLDGLQHIPGRNLPYQRVGMSRLHVIGNVVPQLDQSRRNVCQTGYASLQFRHRQRAVAGNGRPEKHKLVRRSRTHLNGLHFITMRFNRAILQGTNPGLRVSNRPLRQRGSRQVGRDDACNGQCDRRRESGLCPASRRDRHQCARNVGGAAVDRRVQFQFDPISPHRSRLIQEFARAGNRVANFLLSRFGFWHDGTRGSGRDAGQFEQQARTLGRRDQRMRPAIDKTGIGAPQIHFSERQMHPQDRLTCENMHVEAGQYQQLI